MKIGRKLKHLNRSVVVKNQADQNPEANQVVSDDEDFNKFKHKIQKQKDRYRNKILMSYGNKPSLQTIVADNSPSFTLPELNVNRNKANKTL